MPTGCGSLAKTLAVAAVVAGQGAAVLAEGEPVRVPEIVVTATRTAKNAQDVPASVDVITAEQAKSSGAATVDQLLPNIVGVELLGSGVAGPSSKVSLRGLTPEFLSKRVLVLMDGRRLNEQYQGSVEFGLLPADGVERIEVLRGPASALYGSNAEGGVINVVSQTGRTLAQSGEPTTRVSAAGGSYASELYRFSHGGVEGALDYFVAGSYFQTDGYTQNSDGTDRDWQAWNASGNAGWTLTKDAELRFFTGAYGGQGTDENSDRTTEKNYQNLLYTWNWSDPLDAQLQVRAYRNYERHVYDWKFPGKGIYRQDTYAAEVQQSLWASDRHFVTGGFESRRDAVDIDEFTGPIDRSATLAAFYAQDEVHVTESFWVTAGLRNDHNSGFGDELSPRLGLLWKATESTDLYTSFNRAHRAPSLSDRYVNAMYNGFQFIGNPDLGPETLLAYEVGWRQRVTDRVQFELAVFHNDLKDGFDFMLDPDGVFRVRNITRIRNTGVEGSVRCRLTTRLSGFVNYTYTDGTYAEFPANPGAEGNPLAFLAQDKGSVGLEYQGQKVGHHSVSCRVASARYADAENTPENRMPGYAVVCWKSRVPIAPWTTATLTVDNLFDRSYREAPGLDQPGQNVMLGVEAAF